MVPTGRHTNTQRHAQRKRQRQRKVGGSCSLEQASAEHVALTQDLEGLWACSCVLVR